MQKLEKAVENLIKAVGKIHPVIQTLKQSIVKPPQRRNAKTKLELEPIAAEAMKEAAVTAATTEVTTEPITTKNKRIKFTKGSQEAKDFMNMLRQRRAAKK